MVSIQLLKLLKLCPEAARLLQGAFFPPLEAAVLHNGLQFCSHGGSFTRNCLNKTE